MEVRASDPATSAEMAEIQLRRVARVERGEKFLSIAFESL